MTTRDRLARAMVVQREVTRTQAETWLDLTASLADSLEQYLSLYEYAPIGHVSLDGNGVVRQLNAAASDLLGDPPERAVGKPMLGYVSQRDAPLLVTHLRQCSSGSAVTELRLRQRQGSPRPVQLLSKRIFLPGSRTPSVTYHTVMIDITDRRSAERALRDSEKRHREIVETANEGICIVDNTNTIVFANRRFGAMVGTTSEDLLGRSAFDLVPEPDRSAAQAAFERLEAGRGGQSEGRLRRVDGSTLWTNVSTSLMTDEKGRFTGMLRMFTDATARQQLAEARQVLMRELVAAQEQERTRIARELHDQLGQHIVALSLGLARLARLAADLPETSDTIQQLLRVSDQLGRDVHTLALELRPAALDHLGLSVALSSYAEDIANRTGIEIDIHCDDVSAFELSSAVQTGIYRIAQEALSNVVKHAKARHVSVILERHADALQLIVEDDGAGFDQSTTPQIAGRPRLGIAGMQERATIIGGTLNVESTRERGTTVYLRMPIHAAGTKLDETPATVAR